MLRIYKPNSKFPASKGSAFQFEKGIKNAGTNPTPCMFITAAPQTKPKPAQISKDSAFVWSDPQDKKKPHPEVIKFCCDLDDLTKLLVVLEGNHYKMVGQNREWLSNVQLTHKWTPAGGEERTTSFQLDHSDKSKDMVMKLSRNPGHKGGWDNLRMFLQPQEKVALRELVRNVIQSYYQATMRKQ